MTFRLKKIFAPVALGAAILGLAGCESQQDIAAKPAVIQQMVANSASVCETGPVHADKAAYEERLTKVLTDVTLKNLKTLQAKDVTVCLDQRLEQATRGFWEGRLNGVYYPGADGGGIAAILDDGHQPSEGNFWSPGDAYFRGASTVDGLAISAGRNTLPAPGGYLASYLTRKYKIPVWLSAAADKGTLTRNPQLLQPPVKTPAIKPAS